jgi:hypothetical protein
MHMSEWQEKDGYIESVVSWNEFSLPIAVMRCVKDSNGDYEPIIREARRNELTENGVMLASYPKKCTLDYAKYQCIAMMSRMAILDAKFE